MSNGIRQSAHKQIRALRATVASVIAQIEALEETLGRTPCAHPEDHRKMLATFDNPNRFECGVCGVLVEPPTEAKKGE